MKKTTLILITFSLLLFAACAVSKKNKKHAVASAPGAPATPSEMTTPPATPAVPVAPAPPGKAANIFPFSKPADGIYEPGTAELTAVQANHPGTTLDKLKEGYVLYTKGACVNCHNAKPIYIYKESDWKGIIDDMAQKAELPAAQKDAVYKYVLAIKATQP